MTSAVLGDRVPSSIANNLSYRQVAYFVDICWSSSEVILKMREKRGKVFFSSLDDVCNPTHSTLEKNETKKLERIHSNFFLLESEREKERDPQNPSTNISLFVFFDFFRVVHLLHFHFFCFDYRLTIFFLYRSCSIAARDWFRDQRTISRSRPWSMVAY